MIHVRELQLTYPGGALAAVRGLSFTVEAGEIFGFLGPSGAGKSTTQKVLVGLLKQYSGHVQVRGIEARSWRARDYEHIGVSFEAPTHFLKLTGLENLRYFAALYRGPTRSPSELLETVGLRRDADKPVAQYSKGMKARLTLARSLLGNPQVLFLDEPTSGLDPTNAQRTIELIRAERAAGRTLFITTHDMVLADAVCDRIAFIVDGQIVCTDSPRALKLRYGERAVRVEHTAGGNVSRQDFPLDGLGDNTEFLRLLQGAGVQTIHTREANLAEIFIRVTGRGLG